MAKRPLGLQSTGLAATGRAWRVVDDRGQESPAVGGVAHGACACRPVSALQLAHRIELAHQTAGSTDPGGAGKPALPIGQIESRSIATAAFFGHSCFGGMVRASQLAMADDAGDA